MAFRVSATSNADDLERRLNNVFARQIPFATALGLTRTAQTLATRAMRADIRSQGEDLMRSSGDDEVV